MNMSSIATGVNNLPMQTVNASKSETDLAFAVEHQCVQEILQFFDWKSHL